MSFFRAALIIHFMVHCRTCFLLLLFFSASNCSEAATAKVIKVLPHYLDLEGRHSISPSLYDRDAYQAYLRNHPAERSALRFDIQWKAKSVDASKLKLRMELRTSKGAIGKPLVLERSVNRSRWFSHWSALTVVGRDYEQMGDVVAWRATLWNGEQQLAEQESFLW